MSKIPYADPGSCPSRFSLHESEMKPVSEESGFSVVEHRNFGDKTTRNSRNSAGVNVRRIDLYIDIRTLKGDSGSL